MQLLTTDSPAEAQRLAERLEELNRERQKIEADLVSEAVEAVNEQELPALVLASRRWHVGVVGIAAARLVERFHRPTVVIAIDERGVGKGSARTVGGFDLYQGLAACQDLLDAFGGHPSAAGVTVQESRLDDFRERFTAAVASGPGSPAVPTLHVDAEVQLSEVTATPHQRDRCLPSVRRRESGTDLRCQGFRSHGFADGGREALEDDGATGTVARSTVSASG